MPVFASVGLHPEHAPKVTQGDYDRLAALLEHPKVLLLGEIGLDYYWKPYDTKLQAEVFVQQMQIAKAARKPISIHTRDAWTDTIELLRSHWAPTGLPCIMHCFTGTSEQAKQALELGFYLSFSGVVTYSKATDVHDSCRYVPLDRILVETDAPYLAPVPYRGKRNEPSYVTYTANRVAELRGMDPARIGRNRSPKLRHNHGVIASISAGRTNALNCSFAVRLYSRSRNPKPRENPV